MDTYKSMTELVRNEKDWMIETQDRNSKSLITAIHGGGIECGTSELALLVSELSNSNYFTFKGLKPKTIELYTSLQQIMITPIYYIGINL